MAAAGIDVALPVYWGFPGSEKRANVRFSTLGLRAMVEALDVMTDVDLVLTLRAKASRPEPAIEFDSLDRHATLDGAYTPQRIATGASPGDGETATGECYELTLKGARLANRQNGGADLRIVLRGGSLELFEITLRQVPR